MSIHTRDVFSSLIIRFFKVRVAGQNLRKFGKVQFCIFLVERRSSLNNSSFDRYTVSASRRAETMVDGVLRAYKFSEIGFCLKLSRFLDLVGLYEI